MADEAKVESGAAQTVKVPMLPLLLCVLAAAMVAVGGAGGVVWWMAKSGRLPMGNSGAATAATAEKAVETPTHAVAMEPLLANLADGDGHAYLRLGVVLQVEDEKEKKDKSKEKEDPKAPSPVVARLRDVVLEVVGREKSEELLGADGKSRLKQELKDQFAKDASGVKVHDVYFTDFLVQR